jgi:hypothetical protein
MDTPCLYEIRVRATLTDRWSTWFEGLQVRPGTEDGTTVLKGRLADQSALFGVLFKLHALNVELISLRQLPPRDKVPSGLPPGG